MNYSLITSSIAHRHSIKQAKRSPFEHLLYQYLIYCVVVSVCLTGESTKKDGF